VRSGFVSVMEKRLMTTPSPQAPRARRGGPPWFLLPKLVLVAVLLGGFVCVLILILTTPRRDPNEWQALLDVLGTLFRWVIVPASFGVVVFSLLLFAKMRRWFLARRWAQVKLVLLVVTLPTSHLAARSIFGAMRREVAQPAPEGLTGLLTLFTALVVATIAVLVVTLWLARFKPRLGQGAPVDAA